MYTILAISDNDKQFGNAIKEYATRMRSTLRIVNLPPASGDTREEIIQTETQALISYIYTNPIKRSHIIVLDSSPVSWTTDQRCQHCPLSSNILCII